MADYSLEMACLRAIRNSRAMFREAVLDAARAYRAENPVDGNAELTGDELQKLKSDGLEQVAEFLFVLSELELHKDPARIEAFLENHNRDITDLIDTLSREGRHKLEGGASMTTLRRSSFSDARIKSLVVAAEFDGAYLDQSDFGRILVGLMSPETCRKYLEVLDDTGFLIRAGSSSKPIRSRNVIEGFYREHLRRILESTKELT